MQLRRRTHQWWYHRNRKGSLICGIGKQLLVMLSLLAWVLYSQSEKKIALEIFDNANYVVSQNEEQQSISTMDTSPNGDDNDNDKPQTAASAVKLPTDYPGYMEATQFWPNSTATCAYTGKPFYSGFKNQIMALTMILIQAKDAGCDQVLVEQFRHKDTHGTNQYIPHIGLYDMVHFNSFYPEVPRLVRCDPQYLTQFDCDAKTWTVPLNSTTVTSPIPILGKQHQLFGQYMRYSALTGNENFVPKGKRHPTDLAILRGAQRPHPFMQAIINKLLEEKFGSLQNDDSTYMTLHARVEPDMVAHPKCPTKKEVNLTKIFQFLEHTFPDPPAPFVFMPINRQYMEKEGFVNEKHPNKTNWIAVDNLNALDKAVQDGLWGGRTKVFEFGANVLKGSRYERRSSIVGAMVNYYVALGGNVFVGTEISTYAMDLLAARFYRGNTENYKYGPNGIERWMKETDENPPSFGC